MAARFLAGLFSGLGYKVRVQEFEAIEILAATRLVVDGPDRDEPALGSDRFATRPRPWIVAFPLGPVSLAAEGYAISGPLSYADQGRQADYVGANLAGKVALIEQDTGSTVLGQVERAAAAGAVAAVIFNDELGGTYFEGRLHGETRIPAVGITNHDGRGLVRELEEANSATVIVDVRKRLLPVRQSRNVIAELNNDIGDDEVLVVGAHYDTSPGSWGANDNGSGVAVLSVLAQELADDELPFDLRLLLCGAEEIGLNGSFAYLTDPQHEKTARIMAMINLDSVGAGAVTVIGSDEMVDRALEAADAIGLGLKTVELSGMYAGDHLPFINAGIDSMTIWADDITYINTLQDTLERLQPKPLAQAAELALEIVEQLAAPEQ
ncbi:MAG: M28 family metallopeptidase [Actinomycetia bacterium]|nr:M28 family metallopeptidase [Actinomycetes bacterium]